MKPKPLPPLDLLNSLYTYDHATGFLFRKSDGKRVLGSLRAKNYLSLTIQDQAYFFHRIVWMMAEGEDPGEFQVDHIDGDGLNNARANLRLADKFQNAQNAGVRVRTSSGVKGVIWESRKGKWLVRMSHNGRTKCFGRFRRVEDAEVVAIEARKKLHGEYANFDSSPAENIRERKEKTHSREKIQRKELWLVDRKERIRSKLIERGEDWCENDVLVALKIPGLCWERHRSCWRIRRRQKGVRIDSGRFKTLKEALDFASR